MLITRLCLRFYLPFCIFFQQLCGENDFSRSRGKLIATSRGQTSLIVERGLIRFPQRELRSRIIPGLTLTFYRVLLGLNDSLGMFECGDFREK